MLSADGIAYGELIDMDASAKVSAWPFVVGMLIYNIWMILTIFTKKPKAGKYSVNRETL